MTHWTLNLPWATPPLTANQRMHWAKRARTTRMIRNVATLLAKQQKIPPQNHITVKLTYTPQHKRRRDPSNLMPTQKALIDGLRDAHIVPDDTPEYVTEKIPTINPPQKEWPKNTGRLNLTITTT